MLLNFTNSTPPKIKRNDHSVATKYILNKCSFNSTNEFLQKQYSYQSNKITLVMTNNG